MRNPAEPGPMPSLKLREINRSGWPGVDYAPDDDMLQLPIHEAVMRIERQRDDYWRKQMERRNG